MDYCFKHDDTPGNYSQKDSLCTAAGGNLVKIDTAEKASAMHAYLNGRYPTLKEITITFLIHPCAHITTT